MCGVKDFDENGRVPKPCESTEGKYRILAASIKTLRESKDAREKAKAKANIQALQYKPVGE